MATNGVPGDLDFDASVTLINCSLKYLKCIHNSSKFRNSCVDKIETFKLNSKSLYSVFILESS